MRLNGEVHAVIGAGDGIGRQTAHAFSSAGATVLCIDIDAARAAEVARETHGIGAWCDITREGDIDRVLTAAAGDAGPIAGVTNIVGMTRWKPLTESTHEDWLWQNEIVAGQALRTVRAGTPFLRRAGDGCLTFVASVSAFTGTPTVRRWAACTSGTSRCLAPAAATAIATTCAGISSTTCRSSRGRAIPAESARLRHVEARAEPDAWRAYQRAVHAETLPEVRGLPGVSGGVGVRDHPDAPGDLHPGQAPGDGLPPRRRAGGTWGSGSPSRCDARGLRRPGPLLAAPFEAMTT